jgi:hypothetical protein
MHESSRRRFYVGEIAYLWDCYFAGAPTSLKPAQIAALICREYGWTWEQYQKQPSWFLDVILELLKAESAAKQKEST